MDGKERVVGMMRHLPIRHCEDPGRDPGDAAIQLGVRSEHWIASPGMRRGRNDDKVVVA